MRLTPAEWAFSLVEHTAGFGRPIYTNTVYPFPVGAVSAPHAGTYQTSFSLPGAWAGRRTLLRFDGVDGDSSGDARLGDGAVTVWLNGREVGYSQDGGQCLGFAHCRELRAAPPHTECATARETHRVLPLQVTDACAAGEAGRHTLSVQVVRFSDASYLEDQDQWWLSGIHRDVVVYSKPRAAAIADFYATTSLAGTAASAIRSATVAVRVGLRGAVFAAAGKAAGGTTAGSATAAEACRRYEIAASLHGLAHSASVDSPLTLRGVNRHDHSAEGGKAVEWGEMLSDALTMKRHNFNAVRTAHYPNATAWYELCDAVGLWVANIETHGFLASGDEGILAKTPSWRLAFLARFARMVQRDKNHPCVIGGFVWDWIDQGLARVDVRSGRTYYAYGGDFGEATHDGDFNINGLCFPDRRPHPALEEVKHVQRPNRYDFVLLGGVRVRHRLEVDGALVGETAPAPLPAPVPPHCSAIFDAAVELSWEHRSGPAAASRRNPMLPREAFLSVEVSVAAPSAWAPAGFVIATEQHATWYGRGPFENYPDRCSAAKVGVHAASADELATPYVYPSEHGHRTGTRWVEVGGGGDGEGEGGGGSRPGGRGRLRLSCDAPFGFGLLRHGAARLAAATHQDELFAPDPLAAHLTVDAAMAGVGGDIGWGPCVREAFTVPPGVYRWATLIEPPGCRAELSAPMLRRLAACGPRYEPPRRASARRIALPAAWKSSRPDATCKLVFAKIGAD
ncbi:hypothetical protein EMIHUDRAFT_459017 [Emiliania huxleyi CCMP1516]|uniref:beta-galactosidase n=2 Tax=Emiliania huxleyi TaxID=2903 RepID=A0A0D3J152_EMIH1|nr:hypothetical protein EMIHUDRAFT_459017 [Emiliania huxleyi CCMP1516]EOD17237.1 hypothetical protein EMIHUDRAFT_459017 [Emiliania huxleyi CCMP1516]|eukprot:XP_005769666.1 hypothetical protein EMIHUDRAFT_459017 [Emiliania huxleyi CCMP1516]